MRTLRWLRVVPPSRRRHRWGWKPEEKDFHRRGELVTYLSEESGTITDAESEPCHHWLVNPWPRRSTNSPCSWALAQRGAGSMNAGGIKRLTKSLNKGWYNLS